MRSFTDTKGREWSVDITVAAVRRVRDATSILLTSMYENRCSLMEKLASDVVLLVDVLWATCKPQAAEAGITAEQFAEAMGGNSLASATEALVRATADFFSSQEQRDAFQGINNAILDTSKATMQQASKIVTEAMEQVDPSQLATSFLGSVMNGQELPESTRTPELSVS
jgi:hypothetical protein